MGFSGAHTIFPSTGRLVTGVVLATVAFFVLNLMIYAVIFAGAVLMDGSGEGSLEGWTIARILRHTLILGVSAAIGTIVFAYQRRVIVISGEFVRSSTTKISWDDLDLARTRASFEQTAIKSAPPYVVWGVSGTSLPLSRGLFTEQQVRELSELLGD